MMFLHTILLQTVERNDQLGPMAVLALACVVVASSLGLAVSIGLARRVQQIGDQGPGQASSLDIEEADAGDHIDRE